MIKHQLLTLLGRALLRLIFRSSVLLRFLGRLMVADSAAGCRTGHSVTLADEVSADSTYRCALGTSGRVALACNAEQRHCRDAKFCFNGHFFILP
jgi:hypothetical protein